MPVFNESVQRVGAYRANFPPTRLGGEPISIPTLTPVVRSVVDRRSFSFIGYVRRQTTRQASSTNGWRRVFVTFRELEVRLLLGEIETAVEVSAQPL